MRLIKAISKEEIKKRANWHKLFAWLPKRTNNGALVWLEFIERRFLLDINKPWIILEIEYREKVNEQK